MASGLIALIAQAVASAGAGAGASAADVEAARKLPLPKLAGQAIVMRFLGDRAPDYVLEAMRRERTAGVILFGDNATYSAGTKALTGRLRDADPDALIATDQEGGTIRILGWARPSRDQYRITRPGEARAAARGAAKALRSHGINVNLAPVADRSNPGSLMDARAFPGGTGHVARLIKSSVAAYAGSGVAPTAKHFPGLGAAVGNTDSAQVTIDRSAALIGRFDLPPFQAAINAGVPAVMLSHALYPALDRSRIASQSHAVVTDLLKERMGFTGVAMTDSLEAEAVTSRMSMETAAVRSIRAGIDLLLTTGQGTHVRALRALTAEARRNPAFRERLTNAVARVAALRRSLAALRP